MLDDDDDAESESVLAELENIDDECDQRGIVFVKIDDAAEAKEYGLDNVPALVYFEDGVPSIYEGLTGKPIAVSLAQTTQIRTRFAQVI